MAKHDLRARAAGIALMLAAPAGADEIFLKSGGRLVGEVLERGARIVVDVDGGEVAFPAAFVVEVIPGPTPQSTFRARAAQLGPGDLQGWLELGQWARSQRLEQPAGQAFRRALFLDPDNAAANIGLGKVQLGGRWLSEDESYQARGYVRFEDHWMRPEERDEIQRAREQEARVRAAQLALEAQAREAEARARAAEKQAQAAVAQAEWAEEQRRQRHHHRAQHTQVETGFTVCTLNGRSYFCAPNVVPGCERPLPPQHGPRQRR